MKAGPAAAKNIPSVLTGTVEHLPKKVIGYAGRTFEEVVININRRMAPLPAMTISKGRQSQSFACR